MKKAGICLILILIISLSLTYTSVCFAASVITPGDVYHEVIAKDGLQTYILEDTTYKESIIIPYSYFFKVTNQASNGYYKISYGGFDELYILETIGSNQVKTTSYTKESDFTQSPYYILNLSTPSTQLTMYNNNFEAQDALTCTVISFIGYAKHEDKYYFFAKITTTLVGDIYKYIAAEDVLDSTFNPTNIAVHPDSKEAKDEQESKNIEIAQNQLRRNIFFFVICILCVLVVILIYNPFKKKSSRKVNINNIQEDEF